MSLDDNLSELKNSVIIFLLLIYLWAEDNSKKRKNLTNIAKIFSDLFYKLNYNHKLNKFFEKGRKKKLKISSNTIKKYTHTLRQNNILKSDLSTNDVHYFPFIGKIKSLIKDFEEDNYDQKQLNELLKKIDEESSALKKKCLSFFNDFKNIDEFTEVIGIIIQCDWLIKSNIETHVLLITSLFDSFRDWITEYVILNDVIYDIHSVIWEMIFDDVPILNYFVPYPSFDALYSYYNLNLPDNLKSNSQTQVYFNFEDENYLSKSRKINSLFIVSHLEKSLKFKNRNQENKFKERFKLHIQKSMEEFFKINSFEKYF